MAMVRQVPAERSGEAFAPLLSAARTGAPWAWQHLYQQLSPAVIGYLRSQGMRNAEEVAGDVWVGVVRNIASFEGTESDFRSWVFTIAHRRLADEWRRAARRPELLMVEELPEPHGSGDLDAGDSIVGREIWAVCRDLPPEQRDVVLLRVLGDMSIAETARVLDKTEGAVKQLQHRAFARLRSALAEEHPTGESHAAAGRRGRERS